MAAPRGRGLAIVLSILMYMALGLPVWWFTTRIQRPALPHLAMQQSPHLASTLQLPVSVVLHIPHAPPGLDASALAERFYKELTGAQSDPLRHVQATVFVAAPSSQGPHLLVPWPPTAAAPADAVPGALSAETLQALHSTLGSATEAEQTPAASSPTEEGLDALWSDLLQQSGLDRPGRYHIVVLKPQGHSSAGQEEVRGKVKLVVGQHRTAFLWAADDSLPHFLEALKTASPALTHAFTLTAGRVPAGQQPLSAAGEALLSFSLCNADPGTSYSSWDFPAFHTVYLEPLVDALKPAASLSVESQVLLYTPSSQKGSWSAEHQAHVVSHAKLQHFIDSHWSLNTGALDSTHVAGTNGSTPVKRPTHSSSEQGVIPKHVLHFVAYVPPEAQRPLLLLLPSGQPSPTNSLHVPSWGGLHVTNPPTLHEADRQQSAQHTSTCSATTRGICHARAAAHQLPRDQMTRFAGAVVAQLRTLLGVDIQEELKALAKDRELALELHVLPARTTGVAAWEVDVLQRQRSLHNAATAAQVLSGLSRLVEQLPSLEMPDLIGDQVHAALRQLQEANAAAQSDDHDATANAAQGARHYSELAFSNPAILAQLSYPPSHLIGVYMPLFAPLGMALVQALLSEVRRSWRRS